MTVESASPLKRKEIIDLLRNEKPVYWMFVGSGGGNELRTRIGWGEDKDGVDFRIGQHGLIGLVRLRPLPLLGPRHRPEGRHHSSSGSGRYHSVIEQFAMSKLASSRSSCPISWPVA